MLKTELLLLIAIATAAAPLAPRAQTLPPNAVINGSFESPGLPAGQSTRVLSSGDNFIQAWTVIDDNGEFSPFYTKVGSAHGSYAVVLDQQSGIRTTVRTQPNTFYELGLWVEADDCAACVVPAPLRIRLGGQTVSIVPVSGRAYYRIQFHLNSFVNTLEIFNPSSTGAIKQYYIDDVSLRPVAATLLSARLMPVITFEGVIGGRYEIQATTNLAAPVWTTLTNLIVSNNPTLFIDTDPLFRGRTYRAIRVPNTAQIAQP
ncbi:MAG TPA: hypothetical protein VF773_05805 [Verrucomicrobiae bacterium]